MCDGDLHFEWVLEFGEEPLAPADTPYARLVRRVWERIVRTTGMSPVLLPGVGQVSSYCPVACGGTLVTQFLDSPPRIRFSAGDALDCCSMGCDKDEIFKALA